MSFVVVFPHGHSFGVKDRRGLENFLAHRVLISNFTPLIEPLPNIDKPRANICNMQIPGLNLLNNSIEKEFTHPYGQITQDSTATGDHVADSVSSSIEGTDAPQPSAVEIYDSSLINDENLRDSTATSALKDLAVDPLELALAAAASREIQSRFHESSATVLNITEE